MERDFMGLNSKEEAIQVLLKSSAIQWSLSSKDLTQKNIGENVVPREPVQLTIFYKGVVNVYNDMSPDKAQAIMLLAGDGTRAQAHLPTPRIPAGDEVHVSQPMNTTLSSPVLVGRPSTATDAPKVISSIRQVMQSDVPQMRGASLARFLEKRRERVMASTPYSKPGSSSAPSKDDKN